MGISLRWIFLDEVEATGTAVMAQLEHNVRFDVPDKSPFKYEGKHIRPFGGVNISFLGDFWQFRPTGQICLMSNLFAPKVDQHARAQFIMAMLWYSNISLSMQSWRNN